jgi:DNA modification methylase
MQNIQIKCGDCVEIMKTMRDNSIDSIVTDPPAGIAFMGKDWDKDKGGRDKWIEWMTGVAIECLRVLKPGGHALVWSIPRTSHWTATAWENAGFEVRDRIEHIFSSGFPKSLNISVAIDKEAGAERKIIGNYPIGRADGFLQNNGENIRPWQDIARNNGNGGNITVSATPEAKQWEGWGTGLKPSVEDWWLFRKPISEKTVAKNVLKWGTGAINIDECRVPGILGGDPNRFTKAYSMGNGNEGWKRDAHDSYTAPIVRNEGRWPAQIIHDGSEEVTELFPDRKSAGKYKDNTLNKAIGLNSIFGVGDRRPINFAGETGSSARFFYCAKASKSERNGGNGKTAHPTVKPLALMRYLITLVTPPNGVILDPFLGSGSTLVAAKELGFSGRGIDNDPEYIEIAKARIDNAKVT